MIELYEINFYDSILNLNYIRYFINNYLFWIFLIWYIITSILFNNKKMNLLVKYFISIIASKRINKSHCDNRENEYFSDDKNNIKVKKFLI